MNEEIKWQVCSQELAEELKKLGVKQESLFWWYQEQETQNINSYNAGISQKDIKFELYFGGRPSEMSTMNPFYECSAFTTAELGKMLPQFLEIDEKFKKCDCGKTKKRIYFKTITLDIRKSEANNAWLVRYIRDDEVPYWKRDETEANARAKMLIHLIKNNLICLEK